MGDPADQVVIRARDLVVGFGAQVVLDHLSLDLKRGEILGVVGASGSGKSVLLRTVIGLVPKRGGSVEFFAMGPDGPMTQNTHAMARHWGVLFQQGALFSSLTVRQNIQFPLREYLRFSDRLLDEMATAKLELVGLSDRDGDKFPSEISGGMTKRAALARALALDPQVVFLDEPTSGLDPISAGDFDALIRTLQQTLGLTVFMVTHDLDSLHTVCDRIAVLANGKVVAAGPIPTMLACEHPWVKSYFRGRRSRAAQPRQTDGKTMETRAPYALIGLFVLAAVGAVFGFVYWLHNTGGLGERTVYRVRFENNVAGLLTGAAVLFNGIRVGEVVDLQLNPDNPREVTAAIAVVAGTPVRTDTRAGLEFQGLTGVPVISLLGGDAGAAPLGSSKTKPAILAADPAAGQSMTEAARQALRKLDTLLADNSDSLHSAIANLNTFTAALARNSDRVDGILTGLEHMAGAGATKALPVSYDLTAPRVFPPPQKAARSQIIIPEPATLVVLDTQRIIVDSGAGEPFENVQWSDILPKLLQEKIIQSFEASSYVGAVA